MECGPVIELVVIILRDAPISSSAAQRPGGQPRLGVGKDSSWSKTRPKPSPHMQHPAPSTMQASHSSIHVTSQRLPLDHPLLFPSSTTPSPHYVSSIPIRTQHLKLACPFHSLLHILCHNSTWCVLGTWQVICGIY